MSSLLTIAMLLCAPALAAGEQADIEVLRPTFSPAGVPGVDDPSIGRQYTWRYGTWVQYARDPLMLYEWGDPTGAVVSNRVTVQAGFSYDLERRFSMRIVLPLAWQWGTEVPDMDASGGGVGDAGVGLRWTPATWEKGALGFRADLLLPTSKAGHWLGEAEPRLALGVLGSHQAGRALLLADAGLLARSTVDTGVDLAVGSELVLSAGARVDLLPWLDASVVALGRTGLSAFLRGEGSTTLEPLASLHVDPTETVHLHLGVGAGLGGGYGTTTYRVVAGVGFTRPGPEPMAEGPRQLVISDEVPDLVITKVEPEEPVQEEAPWEEGQVARVESDAIAVREPIQFELNTANILPESLPTLEAVARLLNEDGRIGHLLIEGHASEEGDYAWNYQLSMLRSQAVWKQLVQAGVHPARMSARGMGEVVPKVQGDDEAALATNRRVEFQIVYWLEPGEASAPPPYRVRLPWTGDTARVGWPLPPEPKPDEDDFSALEDMDVDVELDLLLAPESPEETP